MSQHLLHGCLPEAEPLVWNCRQLCLTGKRRLTTPVLQHYSPCIKKDTKLELKPSQMFYPSSARGCAYFICLTCCSQVIKIYEMVYFVPLNKLILIGANEGIELSKLISYNHSQTLSGLRWTGFVTRDGYFRRLLLHYWWRVILWCHKAKSKSGLLRGDRGCWS